MSEIKLSAKARSEFGKGAARRTRRAGLVPAVLYGHGTDPVHIALPHHDTQLALRTANALLTISIDGGPVTLALPKQVQRDPIKGDIEHLDLLIVKRGEKVTVEIPLVVVDDEKVVGVVTIDAQTLTIEAEATHIPSEIVVSVEGLEIGDRITVAQLKLPEGAVYNGDPEHLILSIAATRAETAAAGEGEEGAEESSSDEA
ncbi:MAG: 50S ribosomal protein L25/general stress protein Ctc [Propionibacteriaceae bacterium]|nr:50S ribosomal protein L25/general stress protein Ctc [Micropruina sp.]